MLYFGRITYINSFIHLFNKYDFLLCTGHRKQDELGLCTPKVPVQTKEMEKNEAKIQTQASLMLHDYVLYHHLSLSTH